MKKHYKIKKHKEERGGASEAVALVIIAPLMMIIFLISLTLFTFFETYSATYLSAYTSLRVLTSAYPEEISLAAQDNTINNTQTREELTREARTVFDYNMRGQGIRFDNSKLSQFDIAPLSRDYEYFTLNITYSHPVMFGQTWLGAHIPIHVSLVGRLQRMAQ